MPISPSQRGKTQKTTVPLDGFKRQATGADLEALRKDLHTIRKPGSQRVEAQHLELKALGIHAWTEKASRFLHADNSTELSGIWEDSYEPR